MGLAGRYVYRKVGESFLETFLSRTTGGKVDVDKEGKKITVTSEVEDSTTLAFEKNDTSGFIGITTEDSKTVISLTLGL